MDKREYYLSRVRVDELELSVRTFNCLKNDNFVHVADLVKETESGLLRIPNFGRKSLNEIKAAMAELGLHLAPEVAPTPPPEPRLVNGADGHLRWEEPPQNDGLLNSEDVEKMLGLGAGWCAKDRCSAALIPHIKIGKSVRYRLVDVHAFIDANMRRSTSDKA